MNHEDFERLMEDTFSICRKKLTGSKRSEYGQGANRLAQFHRSAQRQKECPEQALMGMADKHVDSVYEFVNEIEMGFDSRPVDLWTEKITDLINYLILLRGLICDRYHGGEV